MTETGIVTPEAVVLDFRTAEVGSRIAAELIDLILQAIGAAIVVLGAAILGATVVGDAGVYFGLFAVAFGYPLAFETLWRGRTVGKAALGLRVVTVEGAPVRFRHALVRTALSLVDLWGTAGVVGCLFVLFTPRNQRLGDLVAGTLVLRERTGAPAPGATTFVVPPGWEAYASTIDVAGLTAGDYQAARAFLLRAAMLDAWTRERLARQLAGALLPRLRHTPPPGVPPEAFLLCVAARFQQRQRAPVPSAPGRPAPVLPAPGTPEGGPVPPPADGYSPPV